MSNSCSHVGADDFVALHLCRHCGQEDEVEFHTCTCYEGAYGQCVLCDGEVYLEPR